MITIVHLSSNPKRQVKKSRNGFCRMVLTFSGYKPLFMLPVLTVFLFAFSPALLLTLRAAVFCSLIFVFVKPLRSKPSCRASSSALSAIIHVLLGSFVALTSPSSHALFSVSMPIFACLAASFSVYIRIYPHHLSYCTALSRKPASGANCSRMRCRRIWHDVCRL